MPASRACSTRCSPPSQSRRSLRPRLLRILLNIIWLVFAGLWATILWCLAGIVMCILIITIPFGLQAFKIASFTIWPFGRTLVKRPEAGAASAIGNVIWFLLAGVWLAIAHLVTSVLLAITIIGIPLALANLKLVMVSLTPFGREVVPIAEAGGRDSQNIDFGSL
jgi:uncharacterized membrane protein YccF (DUF307 family)